MLDNTQFANDEDDDVPAPPRSTTAIDSGAPFRVHKEEGSLGVSVEAGFLSTPMSREIHRLSVKGVMDVCNGDPFHPWSTEAEEYKYMPRFDPDGDMAPLEFPKGAGYSIINFHRKMQDAVRWGLFILPEEKYPRMNLIHRHLSLGALEKARERNPHIPKEPLNNDRYFDVKMAEVDESLQRVQNRYFQDEVLDTKGSDQDEKKGEDNDTIYVYNQTSDVYEKVEGWIIRAKKRYIAKILQIEQCMTDEIIDEKERHKLADLVYRQYRTDTSGLLHNATESVPSYSIEDVD